MARVAQFAAMYCMFEYQYREQNILETNSCQVQKRHNKTHPRMFLAPTTLSKFVFYFCSSFFLSGRKNKTAMNV